MTAIAIKGTVERYVSQPREEGFAILAITLPGGKRAKIAGKGLGGLVEGQDIEATGNWSTHPRYGKQFRAQEVRAIVPEDGIGLQRWLAQSAIPGLGEATARRLVQIFGPDTVQRIAEGDSKAVALLGDRFPIAQRTMVAMRAEAVLGPILAEHDIGPAQRAAIFEKYDKDTEKRITNDPYALIADIEGITFESADRMAKAIGVHKTAPSRLRAAAIDALRAAAGDGHTAVDVDRLRTMVMKRTGCDSEAAESLLDDIGHHLVVATTIETAEGQIQRGWALRNLDEAEETIAQKVLDKVEEPSLLTKHDALHYAALAEKASGMTLNAEQRLAVEMALANSVLILDGGPGTGKTTVLRVICMAWQMAAADGWVDARILLAAPTGKAAQRMKESTGIDAMTLHRLLEVDPDTGGFRRNEEDPLEAGFIGIDESSMNDVLLGASFALAWGRANILFIGDPDQLASVGAGRMLSDMIESGVVPHVKLIQVRRQAEGSAIAEGAKAIKNGQMPVMEPGSDFMFIECDDDRDVARHIADLHAAYVSDEMNVQVLTPGHNAEVGTIALNKRLQADSNNTGPELVIAGGFTAREGDKILQVKNDKEIELWNGDAGRLGPVDEVSRSSSVILGDRAVPVEGDALRRLSLAYAMTIHKSQGSEYQVVLIPLCMAHWSMLQRSLFYTGLTRAKMTCIVIGSRRALERSIENDDSSQRITTLKHRLVGMAG